MSSHQLCVAAVGLLISFAFRGHGLADSGAKVFQQKCAGCHGTDGQGAVDGYERPLFGDESMLDLARVIENTMPEDDPESCVGEEARSVAEYIYHDFYSQAARIRKGLIDPPHIELMRLTVPQHRNTVADLIGRFTLKPSEDDSPEESGLRAEYYQSKGMSKADQLKLERVDRRVDFDFGEASPAADITADQFTIIWEGSFIAEDTGFYEFRVSTPNGVRLYLNNDEPEKRRRLRDDSSVAGQAALIDGWVSSGMMQEHAARVFLLGGRKYPLRLEFFKYKEAKSSVKLEWKPPHGVWAVLDQRHLTTAKSPRTFVVPTAFPADDRSLGYERGSSISREWHASANQAAVATAEEVVARLHLLVKNKNEKVLVEFVEELASHAFRRPLSSDEQHLLGNFFTNVANSDVAVRRAVIFVLSSPHFLYSDLTPQDAVPTQHAIASRLAFALWDSLPDQALRVVASSDGLKAEEEIHAHAILMLADPRAKAKLRDFFHHLLELDERDLAKDQELFPEFDGAVITDLRYSLLKFIDEVVWSEASDYRQLLLADYLILNDRLRNLYEPNAEAAVVENGSDSGAESLVVTENDQSHFVRVAYPPGRRAGVLTHPYLLSALAYHNNSSPIHRGVFVTRNVVGRSLKPPPMAVAFKDDEFAPDLTMREKITQLTRDKACISCHSVINSLGFALENYDAVGRWRTMENDKPVNAKSEYVSEDGDTLVVENALDIASFAVASKSAHRAFVSQLFKHLVKQNPDAYGPTTIQDLRSGFAEDGFNVQNLMARIATLASRHGLGNSSASP